MDKSQLLQFAAHEADRRAIRHTPIDILNYVPSDPLGLTLCPKGTVTLFLARRGADILSDVRAAARSRDGQDVMLAGRIERMFEARQRVSVDDAARLLEAAPYFAELRYGGRTLANNLFVPDGLDVVVMPMPHNGGRLSTTRLTLVEHVNDGVEDGLEGVALRHRPPLTAAERAALQQVPRDQFELNLGTLGSCCDDVTFVAFVVFAVITSLINPNPEESLSNTEVAQLGPAKTARRLMELRKEIMGHQHH